MEKVMTPEIADYKARAFVNGMRVHGKTGKMEPSGGEFSHRFLDHPWVRESVTDGWARELRSHLVRVVKSRIMQSQPYDSIEDLMPPKKWVDEAKFHAARYASSAEWQAKNRPSLGMPALLSNIAKASSLSFNPHTGELE